MGTKGKPIKAVIIIEIIVLIAVIVACSSIGGGGSGSGGSSSRTCKSCGRKYTDSANTRSIARTGMCTNCYNNFKWAQAATGKGTAFHHDCGDGCATIYLSFAGDSTEALVLCDAAEETPEAETA